MLDRLKRGLPESRVDAVRMGPDEPEGGIRLSLEAGAGPQSRPALRVVPGVAASMVAPTWVLARVRPDVVPDVVNVHFVTGAAACFLALRPVFGDRLMLSAHGGDLLRTRQTMRARLPDVLRAADRVMVVSKELAGIALGHGVPEERLARIPNGADTEFWSPGDAPPVPGRIAAVGRLLHIEEFDLLIDALAGLPEAEVVVMGEGEARVGVEARTGAVGLGGRVTLGGHRPPERLREKLRRAPPSARPSRFERMPLALIGALARGCPAVAAGVGGMPEVLTPESDRVVPPDDVGTLRDASTEGLSSEAPGAREGARARAERFSEGATYGAHAGLIRGLARPARRAA